MPDLTPILSLISALLIIIVFMLLIKTFKLPESFREHEKQRRELRAKIIKQEIENVIEIEPVEDDHES
ncbi:hypothetical protein QA601_04660 [Chitinispirillales bacterium ANBcel5]|uniref:hypothetical protein n=1 Tax=Cellulosispirillum alkaliphilum TaxID=3039283 RepID=UPI002A4EA8A4|nr:hypothetical protein [Chitinispirillales bacterium ANBcel5]